MRVANLPLVAGERTSGLPGRGAASGVRAPALRRVTSATLTVLVDGSSCNAEVATNAVVLDELNPDNHAPRRSGRGLVGHGAGDYVVEAFGHRHGLVGEPFVVAG